MNTLGVHSVKNISEPVRVYRVLMRPEDAGKIIGEKKLIGRHSRKKALAALLCLAIIAAGLIGWNGLSPAIKKKLKPPPMEKMAYPLPPKALHRCASF